MDLSVIPFFDITVCAILLLSAWYASFSGFVYQIFSVLAWIGSIVVALQAPQYFQDAVVYTIESLNYPQFKVFSKEIAFGLAFLGSLFVFLIMAKFLVSLFHISTTGFINGTLGFAWGLLRGFLIVIAIHLVLVSYWPHFISIQDNSLFLPTLESIHDRLRGLNLRDFIH